MNSLMKELIMKKVALSFAEKNGIHLNEDLEKIKKELLKLQEKEHQAALSHINAIETAKKEILQL